MLARILLVSALSMLFGLASYAQLDYTNLDNWLLHPDKPSSLLRNYNLDVAVVGPDLSVDSIILIENNAQINTGIDVFWVHPTFGGSLEEIKTTPLGELPAGLLSRIAVAQGGLLAKYGRFYAPRYRQASPLTFFVNGQDSLQATTLAAAYADVKAAFLN